MKGSMKHIILFLKRIFNRVDNDKVPINSFTLCFNDRQLNKEFSENLAKKSVNVVRLSMLFGITIYVVFGFIGNSLELESPDNYLSYRISGIIMFLAVIALTFFPAYKKYSQIIISGLVLGGGFSVLMISFGNGNSLYVGLILTSIYAHSLLRFRFLFASLTTWFLITIYLGVIILSSDVSQSTVINNAFFLITANLLGMVASYSIEFYMRSTFWKSRELGIQSNELKIEHNRKTRELEEARQIQLSMLPQSIPDHPLADISVSMTTANEIGGDYYDFQVADDFTLTFAIGDATGHGAQAGAMVTAQKILFSTYAHKMDIIDFMKHSNRVLRNLKFSRLFMAFAIGKLKDNKLEITGAGIPPLMLYRKGSQHVTKIPLKGLPLGSVADFHYTKTTVNLYPGDSLLLMTDGLPELFNDEKEMLGYKNIERLLISGADKNPKQIVEKCFSYAEFWKNGNKQEDDITILSIKMKDLYFENESIMNLQKIPMKSLISTI